MIENVKGYLDRKRESAAPSWRGVNFARELVGETLRTVCIRKGQLSEPFAGDDILADAMARLCFFGSVDTVIETGTNIGSTTACFGRMADRVVSIESNPRYLAIAQENLSTFKNIDLMHGDSKDVLPKLLTRDLGVALFFLDAHWGQRWPLLGELTAISRSQRHQNSIIVIHDFYVPGTDFGYDVYKGRRLDLGLVRMHLLSINPEYQFFYPTAANGARRGWIAVHPGISGIDGVRLSAIEPG